MKKKQGLSLIDVVVVLVCLMLFLMIIIPQLGRVGPIAKRVVCGTNLKGLGTAMLVYANDYDDEFPKLGQGTWSKELGYSYEDNQFDPYEYEGPCTITSSLYMLVREVDVSPKSFICPDSTQIEFEGQNSNNLDIIELWDFGKNPYQHVSYAYHNPYGKFPANGARSASFALMADMNPWMVDGDFIPANSNKQYAPQIIDPQNTAAFDKGNSLNHNIGEGYFLFFRYTKYYDTGFGQNVLYGDGHTAFEKQPNVGVGYDNIYTYWSTEENPTDQDKQGGTAPTGRTPENDAKSEEDSFLVL